MKLFSTISLIFILTFSSLLSVGQVLDFSGSEFQSMADASVGLPGCWSVFGNQAGLAEITRVEAAVSIQDRFLVSELSSRIGLFVLPVESNVVALSFYQFGEIPFRQEKIGFAFARRLFPQLNFGLQFNYYRFFLSEENRSLGTAGLELGIQYRLNKKLIAGIHLLNPYQTGIKTLSGNFYYPSRIQAGIWYRLSGSFSLVAESENDFKNQLRMKTGMEYNFQEKLYLRMGISGNPYQLSSGIGFRLKKLMVDFGNSFHSALGNSPSASFQYQF